MFLIARKTFIVTIHETSSAIQIKLDGINIAFGLRFMHIAGRKKNTYITGTKVALREDDLEYDESEAEDALVMSWLMNSRTDNLASHLCHVDK